MGLLKECRGGNEGGGYAKHGPQNVKLHESKLLVPLWFLSCTVGKRQTNCCGGTLAHFLLILSLFHPDCHKAMRCTFSSGVLFTPRLHKQAAIRRGLLFHHCEISAAVAACCALS